MTTISAIDKPLFWSAQSVADKVLETGITPVGNTTISGLMLISDASENDYLGKVIGKAGDYKPLPDSGWVEGIYGYNGGLVIVRQPHNRLPSYSVTNITLYLVYRPDFSGVLDWVAGESVEKGTHRMYGGKEYTALQAHVTQSDWTPDKTLGVLWAVAATTNEIEVWKAGVFALDALVTHNGRTWKSLMNGNGYEPGVVGSWRDQTVPPLWVAPAGSVGLWAKDDVVGNRHSPRPATSPSRAFTAGQTWAYTRR